MKKYYVWIGSNGKLAEYKNALSNFRVKSIKKDSYTKVCAEITPEEAVFFQLKHECTFDQNDQMYIISTCGRIDIEIERLKELRPVE